MRSKKPELEDVVKQFEAWRGKPHGRLIPEELWKSALGLLDRYSPSTICRHLRLNAGRFKQMREAGGAVAEESGLTRRGGSAGGVRGRGKPRYRSSAPQQVFGLVPSRNGFLEFPPLGVAVERGLIAPTLREVERGPAGCRLTLESAAGTLTVVTSTLERGLVDAFCRLVLGTLVDGSRA